MKKLFLLGGFIGVFGWANAQDNEQDPVLMTVDNTVVTKSEFVNIFKKNNNKDHVEKAELEEYIELFTNFKLKVVEAEAIGLDKKPELIRELAGYRKQLAEPYLTEKEVTDKLILEAYERMNYEIKGSHILVRVDPNASPADTVAAFEKITALRKEVTKSGDFAQVAYEKSEDPSAKRTRGGLGGFYSVFDLVYPFESAAYNLKIGDVSQPVRTSYGYHIIKIDEKRKARGQIRTAHIFIESKEKDAEEKKASATKKINEIYAELKAGGDFPDLAKKYSDDKSSATRGGKLKWFGTGIKDKMVGEFQDAAFALKKNDDYSAPFKTGFGWHIVQRLAHKPLAEFDALKKEIEDKVTKDGRGKLPQKTFIAKLKKKYQFQKFSENISAFNTILDENFLRRRWDINTAKDVMEKNAPIFTFNEGKEQVGQKEFAQFLQGYQGKVDLRKYTKSNDLPAIVQNAYEAFVENILLTYEDQHLEENYPKFKALVKEYRDGILLFELSDQLVWSKALKDSTGLDNFYTSNKESFMWPMRYEGTYFACRTNKIAKKVYKKLKSGEMSSAEILAEVNEDSELNASLESDKFSKSNLPFIAKDAELTTGLNEVVSFEGKYYILTVNQILKPEAKKLDEARGHITAEYQTYLEKEWIKTLREKYEVKVNEDVLYSIK